MPKLKILSGKDVIKILNHFGFQKIAQKGSHVKMVRLNKSLRQVLTIPNHSELDKGTLKAIYRQASRYIPHEELNPFFY